MLRPVSRQSSNGCPRNMANICLVEHRSFSTLEGGMSAASFLRSSFLQTIDAVMLWPVHVENVPQASEHLCPAKLQTRCDICYACQSICKSILSGPMDNAPPPPPPPPPPLILPEREPAVQSRPDPIPVTWRTVTLAVCPARHLALWVSARTGLPVVRILSLGEIASLIRNVYLSVRARLVVYASASEIHCCWDITQATHKRQAV